MGRMSDGALPLPPSFGGPLSWSDKGENPGQESWRIGFNFYSRSAPLRPLISAPSIWCFRMQFQGYREYLQSLNGNPKADCGRPSITATNRIEKPPFSPPAYPAVPTKESAPV